MTNPRLTVKDVIRMVEELQAGEGAEELHRKLSEALDIPQTPEARAAFNEALDELYRACEAYWEQVDEAETGEDPEAG
jgi:hypothetical protein